MSHLRRRGVLSVLQKEDTTDYLCLCANSDNSSFEIQLQNSWGSKVISNYPILEYSKNKKGWSPLVYNPNEPIRFSHAGERIYIRGDNPNGLTVKNSTGDNIGFSTFVMSGSISATGNVQTLLDKTGELESVPTSGFTALFNNCSALTSAPKLPATILAKSCYLSMFCNTGIVEAPELPAINLAEKCYVSMFSRCASLTKAAKMSAQVLANNCCESMYYYCEELITLPKVYALNILSSSFVGMFDRCSKISIRVVTDETHKTEYRIPFFGKGSGNIQGDLFYGTDSDLPSPTQINTTYYTSNELV